MLQNNHLDSRNGESVRLLSDDKPGIDILFVDLPFETYEFGRRFKPNKSYERMLNPYELHLGFRYMVSFLQKHGYTADILFPGKDKVITSNNDLLRAIMEIRPAVLGFGSYEGSLKETLMFIKRIRAKGVKSLICLGGHLATFSYNEILRDHHDLIDVVVIGEGEHTVVELIDRVKKDQEISGIAGIAYYDGDRVVTSDKRPVEPDINRFPFPFLEITDAWKNTTEPLFLTTSRGCYGTCSFCRSSHLGERWRARDPKNVVDEIEHAYKQGISLFEMVDDNFLGPGSVGEKRATTIAKEIQNRGLQINYHISCRVNDVNEPTIRALMDSGLISVSLGVESGVQRILDSFDKNITVDQSIAALQLLNRLEIPVKAYIIFFEPYMTLAEAKENLEFLKLIKGIGNVHFESIIFRKLIPVSGTEIFERLRRDKMLKGNYLTGHYFVFKDPKVSILSDFLETIDLQFEKVFRDPEFQQIDGLYQSFKTHFEFLVAEKAIAYLESCILNRKEARKELRNLLSTELRETFGSSISKSETAT